MSSLNFVVCLVHFTLQEHLFCNPTLIRSPHLTIAEVYLKYLHFQSFRDPFPTHLCPPPPTMQLLKYASVYWGKHARKEITNNVNILALRLLGSFSEHISSLLLLWDSYQYIDWDSCLTLVERGPRGFTGLHGVEFSRNRGHSYSFIVYEELGR